MPQAQSSCVAQPHLLCKCCLGELLWTPLTLYHYRTRTSWSTGKKTCGAGNFFSALVSASQQIPVWFSSLSSGGEPDLQPYSPGSGWFGVLSEIVGWSFLVACLVSRAVSHSVVFLRSHKRPAEWTSGGACGFNKYSKGADFSSTRLLWIRCRIMLGMLDTPYDQWDPVYHSILSPELL